ncbi:MAG: hypothetical protein ONB33_12420 [candidate division KSB1 bacterium]|nr:hypothetical protein [candidate division KSB1 bacterium]MDZ7358395.1 hypothetical protein [candidate division KSB1 bacterium]MDZ7399057.1 hypothetical protein [candidate division KSB1 bacterium]
MIETAPLFRQAGVKLLHPIIGLNWVWLAPDEYDWERLDEFFDRLLAQHREAMFLPRVLLDVPEWWKNLHPEELIVPALLPGVDGKQRYHKSELNPESGWLWGIQMSEPSLASDVWTSEVETTFRALLQHIENSPLRSRIIGYQIGCGIYGEWHYFLAEFMPDLNKAVLEKLEHVPDVAARVKSSFGLFRDPAKEKLVIDFYCRFHEEICAATLIYFAKIVKQETAGRVLCGAFYGYQLENVWIQEGGHLAPEMILNCSHIDFLASPYTYQSTNSNDPKVAPHDVFDDAGNWLGRARGIAGDGGYRVLLESLRRHGKLYFAEIDPATYIQFVTHPKKKLENYETILSVVGGKGSDSLYGSKKILKRDLGQMLVSGHGGWLFDFGTLLAIQRSWYDDPEILQLVYQFSQWGDRRKALNTNSVSEIAAVYDAKSLFITRHWKAEEPYPKGGDCMDYFSYWFFDSQARSLHRIGAPVDFLYRFDLKPEDATKYRLFFMVNLFFLNEKEVDHLRALFRGSGATIIWFYAPGFVNPEKLDLNQMERLTGFKFKSIEAPGPMMIRFKSEDIELSFGTKKERFPRFAVVDDNGTPLGIWIDSNEIALAWKKMDGWNSVYVGTAPLPVKILRWLAQQSKVRLWSSKDDIVRATEDAAMIVATEEGERMFRLPKSMEDIETGKIGQEHHLNLEEGDVKIFMSRREE